MIRAIANAIIFTLNTLCGIGLVVSAYAGCISPVEMPVMGVVVLTFPLWLLAMVVLLVIDLLWWRKTALVALIALAASFPMVWNVCPLNIGGGIPKGTPPERIFTLLTYNIFNFNDRTGRYDGDVNPGVSYILRTDADIVCLQELKVLQQDSELHIGKAQLDSLHERYPYILLSGQALAILSKYPLTNLRIKPSLGLQGNFCDIGAYTVEIDGRRIAIFNLHLQSYGLTNDDKSTYREITNLRHVDETEVREGLIAKLKKAAYERALQAHMLCRFVEYYGGENVIVCGDFNDGPGCYTLRQLGEIGMHEVWPAAGFGPTWTYNDNRLYFRIDHVLWRGAMQPAGISRGRSRISDHYPLLTTFVLDPKDN